MNTRRKFLKQSTTVCAASVLTPHLYFNFPKINTYGVQLYTFRDAMLKNPRKTLEQIAELGIKEIETAKSAKGHYYGLSPKEMKNACSQLGMKLISGHVTLDANFERTMEEAVNSGQDYLICSSLPTNGQTVDNYKKVAQAFNKAGESCAKLGLKFGYHNHEYEFETENDQVLYDVLLDDTEAELVHMELDLGWVIVAGKNPLDYFDTYPGRFPLWHLKDMDLKQNESTEFGKGGLDIPKMLANQKKSGVRHIFLEQEEYANNPFDSMRSNMNFLKNR